MSCSGEHIEPNPRTQPKSTFETLRCNDLDRPLSARHSSDSQDDHHSLNLSSACGRQWRLKSLTRKSERRRTSWTAFRITWARQELRRNEAKGTHGGVASMAGSKRCPRNDGLAIEQCHNSPSFAAAKEWQGRAGNLNMVYGTASNGSIKERYGL